MGKSGWLPDISYNFGFYRTLAVNSLQRKDYVSAGSSLHNLNGCLGDEYLVSVNTLEYRRALQDKSVFQCNHCTMPFEKIVNKGEENEYKKNITVQTEVPLSKIEIYDRHLYGMYETLFGEKTEQCWVCPSCNEINQLEKTKKIAVEREKPFYLRVVPDPPVRLSGLSTRLGFDGRFSHWFWNFLEEINWQEVLYRKEYTSQHDGNDMEFYKDKGDRS